MTPQALPDRETLLRMTELVKWLSVKEPDALAERMIEAAIFLRSDALWQALELWRVVEPLVERYERGEQYADLAFIEIYEAAAAFKAKLAEGK